MERDSAPPHPNTPPYNHQSMTEKKARSVFVPTLVIAAVLTLGAGAVLTLVPIKTCEGLYHRAPHADDCRCQGTGKVIVWDLWNLKPDLADTWSVGPFE